MLALETEIARAQWTQVDARDQLKTVNRMAFGDLSRFSTIVTGIRAYEARPELRSYHHRLMAYVEAGGNLVVQYNRLDFNRAQAVRPGPGSRQPDSPYAPYPAAVTSSRVTDENAPPRVLVPDSPLLTTPNRIGDADWRGWVQERGLNFLEARDPRYADLIAFTDPFPLNPGEKKGALVSAVVDGTAMAPDVSGDVLDELQRAVRELASGLAGPRDLDDGELIERLLRQARLDLDAGAGRVPGKPVRSPDEIAALRKALETLARALAGPAVERYRFASESHAGVEYELTIEGADVTCSCPGFEYRGQCRHARDLKSALAAGRGAPAGYARAGPR